MTITAIDPHAEQVLAAAYNVDHLYCEECWIPGDPMLCGFPAEDVDEECCDAECLVHAACPLCVMEANRHWREVHLI